MGGVSDKRNDLRFQKAAELYFTGEYTYRDIAQELGCSPATVFAWTKRDEWGEAIEEHKREARKAFRAGIHHLARKALRRYRDLLNIPTTGDDANPEVLRKSLRDCLEMVEGLVPDSTRRPGNRGSDSVDDDGRGYEVRFGESGSLEGVRLPPGTNGGPPGPSNGGGS